MHIHPPINATDPLCHLKKNVGLARLLMIQNMKDQYVNQETNDFKTSMLTN